MWKKEGCIASCTPRPGGMPTIPHGMLAAVPQYISNHLPAPSPLMAPAHGQKSWGCARNLRHVGLALLWLEQSLEEASSPGIVWSNCCMLGWAGHLSPSQATTASPGEAWACPALTTEHGPDRTSCNGCPVPQTRAVCQKSARCIFPVPGKRQEDSKRCDLKAQQTDSQAGLSYGTAWCQPPQPPELCPSAPSLGSPCLPGVGWRSPNPPRGWPGQLCACRRAESHAPT